MTSQILKVVATFIFYTIISSQDVTDSTEYQFGRAIKCKRDDGILQRCMPVFENIAFNRDIFANNTCGLYGPSEYCVQTGTSGARKICDICNHKNQGQRHPADLMTDVKLDDNPTWWQSETLLENKYGVHLILDFKKKYNVAFIRIRFHTIRPHSFAIYKKSTYDPNERWLPYQYYSRTCVDTYGVSERTTVTLANQKIALCTDKASGMIPLSGGNVAYLTLDHRPGKKNFDRYPELEDWVTVTGFKFSLDRLNTFGDEVFGDPKVLKSYYFAISDIAVGGRCKCHGHASTCAINSQGNTYCECDHNTAGKDCEKCLPLYNDRPWRRALGRSVNACKKCYCNGLADECVFDEQLWIDTGRVSGGRCVNCQENTAGVNCERCKDHHYRGLRGACLPCNCNKVGSRSLSCNDKGQCPCKAGVDGDKCNRCIDGYYGFSAAGCSRCNCNSDGSIGKNCDATGQCKCRENVVGKQCDQCKANHFDLDKTNPLGCKACFCYGHGLSCTSKENIGEKIIKTSFESDFDGWRLQDEYGNEYQNNLEWESYSQYTSVKPSRSGNLYLIAPQRFLGNRLSSYAKKFSFIYGVYKQKTDPDVVTSRKDIIFEGAGLTATYEITEQGNEEPNNRFIRYEYKLIEPAGMTTMNFQKLLSDLTAIKIRVTYLPIGPNLPARKSAIDDIVLQSTFFIGANSPEQVTWQEKCECEQGYTGDQCERCANGYTRENGATGPLGKCVPCECNNHGNVCDSETGVCICGDNTTGRNCELCKVGFYGNPTAGNSDDCKKCPCIFANECVQLTSKIKCTDCPDGHIGDSCEICTDKYFGDPQGILGNATRCQKCDCNGNVDGNAIGNCDGLTGGCLKCIYNTKNGPEEKCELCADGFYGDALAEPKGNCSACNCFENGTNLLQSHKKGDPISCDKYGKCPCRENVIGNRCDMCPPGHWNVKSGKGCEKCNCHPDGSMGNECDIDTGKCKCKPGVAGRTCNQCAAGNYKFSSTGCKPCNCHPDGSKHQNCTSDGVCECRPGVLGIKCDQCPENNYNLSVGCIACPKCFNLVQVAVNKLREKLSTFNFTKGNYTNKDPGIDIRDKNFEAAIDALNKEIQELRKKTEELLKGDKELYTFFKSLSDQFENLVSRYADLKKMVEKSEGASKTGQTEILKAEEIIELIKSLLQEAEEKLKKEGKQIYNKALSSADDLSGASKRMREIAEEARKLADKHEEESADIKMTTDMAYNTTQEGYNIAMTARNKEEKVNEDLKNMELDASEANRLSKDSRTLINQAENTSSTALAEAEALISDAKQPLPDFKISDTKVAAENVTEDAKDVDTQSNKLVSENELAIDQLRKDDEEGRQLLAEGRKLQEQSNAMYVVAKNASDEAKSAQEDGLRVAKDAKDMLKTLLGFKENIRKSKANATEALKLIDQIRKLIKEANDTAKDADANAAMAEGDANESLKLAQDANTTTQAARREIDDIMAEARDLLNQTMSYMMNQLANTKDDIVKTQDKLKGYEEAAQRDADNVENAFIKSQFAGDEASKAQNDLETSLIDVEDLMKTIENLEAIDYATLEDAEKRFQIAKDTIEGTITLEIENLQKKVKEQNEKIKKYELDLEPLRKQIKVVQTLAETIPTYQCFRGETIIEQK